MRLGAKVTENQTKQTKFVCNLRCHHSHCTHSKSHPEDYATITEAAASAITGLSCYSDACATAVSAKGAGAGAGGSKTCSRFNIRSLVPSAFFIKSGL
jgi:hypothetical protein